MTFCRSLVLVLGVSFLLALSLLSQTHKEKADLLITGGTVVTMDASRTILEDGAVATKGDTIVAVGPRGELEAKYAAANNRRNRQAGPARIHQWTHSRAHDLVPGYS